MVCLDMEFYTWFWFFFLLYFVVLFSAVIFRTYLGARGLLSLTILNLSLLLCSLGFSFWIIVQGESISFFTPLSLSYSLTTIDLNLSFSLNTLSFFFTLLVLIIGFATNIYCLNYFKNEAEEFFFIFWLNLFIGGMCCLVLSNNFFSLFLGWELIGLASFFLINFWQPKRSTLKSSFKAFSFNLISDLFLLLSLVLLYSITTTTDISSTLCYLMLLYETHTNTIWWSMIFLILCASIKSVQLFGHLWLPDSMEAPVPASSLIHSATLVSAGVFLLLRFNVLIALVNLQYVVLYWGALTCAYGGIVAAMQTDMKKLLAYSTMSHCGFLYLCVSTGHFYLTITYLFLHGLFKAATFYCAGSFIRVYGTQDSREMGEGHRLLPLDTVLLLICAINLGGLPFTVGVLYKLFFFKLLLLQALPFGIVGLVFMGLLTSFIYVYRLVYYSGFDFLKTTPTLISFYLNNIQNSSMGWWNLGTKVQLFAVSILLISGLLTYYSVLYFIGHISAGVDYTLFTQISYFFLFKNLTSLYANIIIFFYFLYILIILVVLGIEPRTSNFKLSSFLTTLYIFSGIIILLLNF